MTKVIHTKQYRDEFGNSYAKSEICEGYCWAAPNHAEMLDVCLYYRFFMAGEKMHESCEKEL